MQIRPLPDNKIKIVYKDTNEYLLLLDAIRTNYKGMHAYTKEYAERLEDALQGSFDAEDPSTENHPSSVIENKMMDDVFTLFCFASIKLNKAGKPGGSADVSQMEKLKRDNDILRLTIMKMKVERAST